MELESIYQNVGRRNTEDTSGPRTLNHRQDEGKDEKRRGSRCLVLMTVCLGLICVLLLVVIIFITVERESLQDNYNDLTAEKSQLQRSFDALNQTKLELESKVTSLSDELLRFFFISCESRNRSESRKYCRDRGADLVIINTEEKQRLISSFAMEKVWIGLSDIENEGTMKWVDNSTLNQGFWSKGEPNNYKGDEDCVALNPTYDHVKNWFDRPCSEMKKAFCEKK